MVKNLLSAKGDAGDYHECESIDDVASYLHGIDPESIARRRFGIETSTYYGDNYISLYVGPDVETPERELTNEELEELENTVVPF